MINRILYRANGTYVNPSVPLTDYAIQQASPPLFANQLTLEFYNDIVQTPSGLYLPVFSSVVKTGLSGTIVVAVNATVNSPYPITLSQNTIDISSACMIQWTGISEKLNLTFTGVTGASYVYAILDRK